MSPSSRPVTRIWSEGARASGSALTNFIEPIALTYPAFYTIIGTRQHHTGTGTST